MRHLLLAALLSLAACSAPATQPLLPADAIDMPSLLPPPPADDSAITRMELVQLKDLQASSTPERLHQAQIDARTPPLTMVSVLKPGLAPASLPLLSALIDRENDVAHEVGGAAKRAYHRTRPFVLDPADVKQIAASAPDNSYPSGHTTVATLVGITLAWMVPERRETIFAWVASYARSREIGGDHYPSDVVAGRITGTVIAAALWRSPAFQAAYAPAKAELRAATGLPP